MPNPPSPTAELAATYLRHLRTGDKADSWAFDEVSTRISSDEADGEDAWSLVLTLVAQADESALGYVGAGPLEEFVLRFAADFIVPLETKARQDATFRACLGSIWLAQGALPADLQARVVQASGGLIKPIRPRRHGA